MSTTKAPARGTEVKLKISISASTANYTMDDFGFVVEFYGNIGKVELKKEGCIRLDENNYLAVVDTAITGCGVLDARVSALIPDADCEDGFRTEVVIVKGIETIY